MRPLLLAAALATTPASAMTIEDYRCLASVVYFEARGEPDKGQQAVAWVAINRTRSEDFPDTLCEVIHQPNQFAVGKPDITSDEWWNALYNAGVVVVSSFDEDADVTNGAVMFHNPTVSPKWAAKFERVARIGDHIFYVDSN